MKHPVVALLTDFGMRDHYVAALKGVIASVSPDAKIIDVCHDVGPQNIQHAAFILREVVPLFPHHTVFVCVVDPGVGSARRAICVKHDGGYLLGPDNGLLSLALLRMHRYQVREITCKELFRKPLSSTFHGRDIFAPVAAHLSKGFPFSEIGPLFSRVKLLESGKLIRNLRSIQGEIIYMDQFGNGITNISKSDCQNRAIESVKVRGGTIKKMSKFFSESAKDELMVLWNSSELLEFAIRNGSAKKKYKIKVGDLVKVDFA